MNGARPARTALDPVDVRRRGRWRAPRANSTCSIASSTTASVPGPDEVVLVGDLGGLGAARVDTTIRPPRAFSVAQPLREVGRGHQRAVGGHRVRAEHEEVRGPVEVGDRDQQLVPEELQRDEQVRQLVDRGGAELVARAERLEQRAPWVSDPS